MFNSNKQNGNSADNFIDVDSMEKINETFYSLIKRIDDMQAQNEKVQQQLERQTMRVKVLESEVEGLKTKLAQQTAQSTSSHSSGFFSSGSGSSTRSHSGATNQKDMEAERTQ